MTMMSLLTNRLYCTVKVTKEQKNSCYIDWPELKPGGGPADMRRIWVFFQLGIVLVAPFVVIVTFNVLLLRRLRSRTESKTGSGTGGAGAAAALAVKRKSSAGLTAISLSNSTATMTTTTRMSGSSDPASSRLLRRNQVSI